MGKLGSILFLLAVPIVWGLLSIAMMGLNLFISGIMFLIWIPLVIACGTTIIGGPNAFGVDHEGNFITFFKTKDK